MERAWRKRHVYELVVEAEFLEGPERPERAGVLAVIQLHSA
jgi:hypothetical protein